MRIHFEDLVHAEHVEQDAAFERRADAHADAALGDDGNLMLVGESQNVGNLVIALGVGLDAHDHVWQRPVSTVGQGVLIINLVYRVSRNPPWPDDLSQLGDDLVEGKHRNGNLRQNANIKMKHCGSQELA